LAEPDGSVCESYDYDAYGNLLSSIEPQTKLLYAGEMWDDTLQWYYLRARYYNPSTGRFNRPDPFSGNNQDPQSLHKYLYCHANPIMGIDPSGLLNLAEINVTALIQATLMALNVTAFIYNVRESVKSTINALNSFMQGDFWDGLAYIVVAAIHGSFAVLNAFGIMSCLIGPPPPMASALSLSGGGATVFWSKVVANPALGLWVVKQVAPVAFTGYLVMMSGSAGGEISSSREGDIENHHRVPHSNKDYDFQNHPLLKQAKVNLKKEPGNIMRLGNHHGRHSKAYLDGVKNMLDEAYPGVANQGEEEAKRALKEVYNNIDKEIANGRLKPYINKDVWKP